MPKISLQLKANLENLTNLRPEDEEFRWYLKLQCSSCGETSSNFVYVCQTETYELKGSRSSANLVAKCKLCSRENSISILSDTIKSYNVEEVNTFKTMVTFECRGFQPIEYEPMAGWLANGEHSGVQFEVDLKEREWSDYDEQARCSVGIDELDFRFIKE